MTYRVCFVCTGNICRSPMAESVFRARVAEAGLDGLVEVDSAGTGGWHEGDGADPRTVSVLEEHGYDVAHTARQFRAVLVLPPRPRHRPRRRPPQGPAPPRAHREDAEKVRLLRSYDPAARRRPGRPRPVLRGPGRLRGVP